MTKYSGILGGLLVLSFALTSCIQQFGNSNSAEGFTVSGFIGQSAMVPAGNETVGLYDGRTGKQIDSVVTNFLGKYNFSGLPPGSYILRVGKIHKPVLLKNNSIRLDINLSAAGGTMNYAAQPTLQDQGQAQSLGKNLESSTAAGPSNDSKLAQEISGIWWGYSGSTERKIGLCPGGSYQDYTESSYSGHSHDSIGNETLAWGSARQGGGAGTWTIQGNYQSGVIHIHYANGNTVSIRYEQCGEPGCLLFNGNKLCRNGRCN